MGRRGPRACPSTNSLADFREVIGTPLNPLCALGTLQFPPQYDFPRWNFWAPEWSSKQDYWILNLLGTDENIRGHTRSRDSEHHQADSLPPDHRKTRHAASPHVIAALSHLPSPAVYLAPCRSLCSQPDVITTPCTHGPILQMRK